MPTPAAREAEVPVRRAARGSRDERAEERAEVDAHVEDREAGVAPRVALRDTASPTMMLTFGLSRPVPRTISARPGRRTAARRNASVKWPSAMRMPP